MSLKCSISLTATLVFILFASLQCSSSDVQNMGEDGDMDGEIPEFQIEDGDGAEVEPCEPGDLKCADATAILLCDENGKWNYSTTCQDGEECWAGRCFVPADGDETPDGDNTPDGDETPDGDDTPDGDNTPDGDDTPDGDETPDGDDIPDGDVTVCDDNMDCPWGFECVPDAGGDGCVDRNECFEDLDCPEETTCVESVHWNICLSNNDDCAVDMDCGFGFACQENPEGDMICVEMSECASDEDCTNGKICVTSGNWKICAFENAGECEVNSDCDFGYLCDLENGGVCSYASTCQTDADCQAWESCKVEDNWKQCAFNISKTCASDADCGIGEFCQVVVGSYGLCKSKNECSSDEECGEYEICQFNDEFYECVEEIPCNADTDCREGYKCVFASPKNYCEYANQCTTDTDCAIYETCQMQGNYTVCKFTFSAPCTSDDGCAEDEYCDLTLGPLGVCRTRSQCFVDADCDEGLICQSNGTYNECIPATTQQCWFDFQCPEDWRCIDGACKPVYAGMCENVEGQWTVLIPNVSCMLITMGSQFEFIPTDGCNGKVKPLNLAWELGSFTETSTGNYDVTFALFLQCTAEVTLSTLMTLNCPMGCDNIQLTRL